MTKTVYVIGHKGRGCGDDKWRIYFHAGMTDGVFDTTYDITKAVRFAGRDELFDYLKTYCYLDRAIIFEFTDDYLARIKYDERIKAHYNDCERY